MSVRREGGGVAAGHRDFALKRRPERTSASASAVQQRYARKQSSLNQFARELKIKMSIFGQLTVVFSLIAIVVVIIVSVWLCCRDTSQSSPDMKLNTFNTVGDGMLMVGPKVRDRPPTPYAPRVVIQ